jgi:hypothetical protein
LPGRGEGQQTVGTDIASYIERDRQWPAILRVMPKQRPSDRLGRLAERPSQVEIAVLVQHQRGEVRERIREIAFRRHRVVIAVLVLVASAIGAVVSEVPANETSGARRSVNAGARERGAAGVAAAYGHPLRCLSITVALHDSAYARADFSRAASCGRYGGYATAIFHWVDGGWRPVLDSLHYGCPAADVPRAVQAELGVCP